MYESAREVVVSMRATKARSSYCDPFSNCPGCFSLIAGTLRHRINHETYTQSVKIACASGFQDNLEPVTLTFTGIPFSGGTFEFVIASELSECDQSPLPRAGEPVIEAIDIFPTPSPPPLSPKPPSHPPSPSQPRSQISSPVPGQPPPVLPPPSPPAPVDPPLAPYPPLVSPDEGFIYVSFVSELRALVGSLSFGDAIRIQLPGGRFSLDNQPLQIKSGNVTIIGCSHGEPSVLDAGGRSVLLSAEGAGLLELRNLTMTNSEGILLSLTRAHMSGCTISNTTGRVLSVMESSVLSLSDSIISHVRATSTRSMVSQHKRRIGSRGVCSLMNVGCTFCSNAKIAPAESFAT